MKVLICDDRKEAADDALKAARIGAGTGADIKVWEPEKLSKVLRDFFIGVRKCLRDNEQKLPETEFDDFDVVILDYNLSYLEDMTTVVTADSIAGYIRAFSGASYIVAVNKNTELDFDLARLVGDVETAADLSLNTKHLALRSLWHGPSGKTYEFGPSYWPILLSVANRRREQIKSLKGKLDGRILDFFGFSDTAKGVLSDRAIGTLKPDAERDGGKAEQSIDAVTFRDFFLHSCKTLAPDDRQTLKDRGADDIISRVIAAEIDAWLRREILAPQDVLVDAPHLLMRMPFLVSDAKLESWTRVAESSKPPFGFNKKLYETGLEEWRFKHTDWVEHPVFWWPDINADEALNKKFFQKEGDWGDFVFCEDVSQFMARGHGAGSPKEFSADTGGAWERRHVARLKGYEYAPAVSFAI